MRECSKECVKCKSACKEKTCRMWINFKEDFNCTLIAVNRHGKMTLKQVAERLDLSIVRIKQIQDEAKQKLQKNSLLK